MIIRLNYLVKQSKNIQGTGVVPVVLAARGGPGLPPVFIVKPGGRKFSQLTFLAGRAIVKKIVLVLS